MWKDRFIKSTMGGLFPLPVQGRQGSAYLDNFLLNDTYNLVRAVDAFRRRGQLLSVGWDELIRHGILTRFRHTWLRREDVEWEMEFQWISQGDPFLPIMVGMDLDIMSIVNGIVAAFNDLVDAVQSVFAIIDAVQNLIYNALAIIQQAVGALTDIVKKAIDMALLPFNVAKAAMATYETVIDQCRSIETAAKSIPARALREGRSVASVTQAEAVEAEYWVRKLNWAARKLRALVAQRQQEAAAQTLDQPQIKIVTAREGQDLRDVSRTSYGTPFEWRNIAQYNRLKGSKLSGGAQILIPRRSARSDRTGNGIR
jgi:hypothetical protein